METETASWHQLVKKEILKNKNHITILLSGNIHNRLLPFRDHKTMACFLANDSTLNRHGKICSINHEYKGGTMINNTGSGLALRTIGPMQGPFSEATKYTSYFCLLPLQQEYTAAFYTQEVNAATILNTSK